MKPARKDLNPGQAFTLLYARLLPQIMSLHRVLHARNLLHILNNFFFHDFTFRSRTNYFREHARLQLPRPFQVPNRPLIKDVYSHKPALEHVLHGQNRLHHEWRWKLEVEVKNLPP